MPANLPLARNGLSNHLSIDLDEGTLEIVKAAPGSIYSVEITNLGNATRFVKIYDAVSGPAGTGTPVVVIAVPTLQTVVWHAGGVGIKFSVGICIGATTGVAHNNTGAPGANEVVVNVTFK